MGIELYIKSLLRCPTLLFGGTIMNSDRLNLNGDSSDEDNELDIVSCFLNENDIPRHMPMYLFSSGIGLFTRRFITCPIFTSVERPVLMNIESVPVVHFLNDEIDFSQRKRPSLKYALPAPEDYGVIEHMIRKVLDGNKKFGGDIKLFEPVTMQSIINEKKQKSAVAGNQKPWSRKYRLPWS